MAQVLCSGSFMWDIIVADLPSLGEPGDLIYAPNGIQLHLGGHSANVAINLIKLGMKDIAVVGGVGDDVFGEYLEKRLEQHSLDVYAERLTDVRTSKNIALIVRGEDRRFYAELAANTMLSPDHVISILELTRPKVFYQGTVGGLKLVDENLDLILSSARKIECITFVDIILPKNSGWRKLKDSLPLIDVLHCNSSESAELTGERDPVDAAKNIIKEGVKLCLITMGSNFGLEVELILYSPIFLSSSVVLFIAFHLTVTFIGIERPSFAAASFIALLNGRGIPFFPVFLLYR